MPKAVEGWERRAGVLLRKRKDGDWDYFPADENVVHRVNESLLAEAQKAWARLLLVIAFYAPLAIGIWIAAFVWGWARTATVSVCFGFLAVVLISGYLRAQSRVRRILRSAPISEASRDRDELKAVSRKLAMRDAMGRSWVLSTRWGLWTFMIASGLFTVAGAGIAVWGLLKGDREEFWIGARVVLFFGGGALLMIFLRRQYVDAAQSE